MRFLRRSLNRFLSALGLARPDANGASVTVGLEFKKNG